jgi:cytochrome P450
MADDAIGGIGVLRAIRRNGFEAFPARCWEEPVVKLDTPFRPVVIAASPEAIRHVMLDHHRDYVRLAVGKRVMGPIVGNGLLVSEGEAWRNQRRAMAPAFTPQKIQALTGLIRDVAERACAELEAHRQQPANLFEFFQSVSLDIGATVMFSSDISAIGAELRSLLTFYMTRIGSPTVSDFLLPRWMPTVSSTRRALFRRSWRGLILQTIANRRAGRQMIGRELAPLSEHPLDLFDLLEQAHGNRPDDLLADEVSTMLVAGHETTALTLFWACALVARLPGLQRELASEAAGLDWGATPDARSAEIDVARLPLTKAVIQETLRLYAPGFLTARLAAETHRVGGRKIPKGAMVLIPFWLLHRNPHRWKAAASFDPRRFIDGPPPDRFDYLPFGVGPRVCIGAQLAITEATLVLARLLRDNTITALDDEMPLPVGRLSTRPSYSPRFSVSVRQPRRAPNT